MARQEVDREDLLAEIRALIPRCEWRHVSDDKTVVAGRWADGRWSLYLGADPVYHFQADGALRKAFVDGQLYRSHGSTLTRLTRERGPQSSALLRYDLSAAELSNFLTTARTRVNDFQEQLNAGEWQLSRQVPETGDVVSVFQEALLVILNAQGKLSPGLK